MSEFNNPCTGGGVYVESATCPGCGREIPVDGQGRFADHSHPPGDDPPLPFDAPGYVSERPVVDSSLP